MSDNFTPTVRIIVEALRSRISSGTYQVGEQLPAEFDLASDFQVGRGSVRSAIEALVDTGELEKESFENLNERSPRQPSWRTRTT